MGAYDFTDADAIAQFAAGTGMRLRGHTLLWRDQQPADLARLIAAADDPIALMRVLVTDHIQTVVGRYRGRVAAWDVVNEPLEVGTGALDQNIFHRTLGENYIAEAFGLAHAIDPDAMLFLNEFFLAYPSAKADGFVGLVRWLRDAGVPIDGVGVQCHFFPFVPLPSAAAFAAFLHELAAVGVTIELTELDVSLWHFRDDPDPLARQAEFYGEIVSACIAVPACQGVTVWGRSDPETWLDVFPPFDQAAPNAPLLLDALLEPKPAYFAVRDALARRIR